MNKENNKPKSNIMTAMINLSLLMISIFPIFGERGILIQKIVIWVTIFLGMVFNFSKSGIIINKFSLLYLCYLIFACFSVFWSTQEGGAVIRIIDLSTVFFFLLILSSNCKNKEDAFRYLDVYLLGVIIISAFCFVKDFSTLKIWARLGKTEFLLAGQNQIYYSCILVYATIYSIYRIFSNKNHRVLNISISVFLYLCGILTAIRKCLIIPIIFIAIFVIIKNKQNIFKLLLYAVITVVLLFVTYKIVINHFPSMSLRIDSLINDISKNSDASALGNSYAARKWLREKALETFLKHPIIGVGVGQFRYYAANGGLDLYAHDNFLEVLANTGIIGFIIYYSGYFTIFINAIKNKAKKSNESVFVISFLLAMLVMEYGQVDYYQLNFIAVLGILSLIVVEKKYTLYFRKSSD